MDFNFTEDQELLRASINELAAEKLGANYLERATRDEYNPGMLKTLHEMGLLGFGIPEELGGQGIDIDPVTIGLICETLGRYDIAAAGFWYANYSISEVLRKFGTDEQCAYWYPKLTTGDVVVAGCFTEPHCGSDLSSLKTTAVQQEDGSFVINGIKASVTYAEADAYQVLANVDKSVDPTGKAIFLVPSNLPGIEVSVYNDFGLKQIGRGDVTFKNVVLSPDMLLGKNKGGFAGIMNTFDLGRPTIGLFCTGSALGVMDKSLEYSKQREAFGMPISRFEAISFGFAEHYARLESYRLIAYKALALRAEGKKNTKEAAMAKFLCCDEAVNSIWFATRVLGHLGYTSEYDACMKMADAMGFAWGDGSWDVCKMITAREIGGREMLPYVRSKKA